MQCYIKKSFSPSFEKDKIPKLLYVCKAETDLTRLPCVMHMHEDYLEILFIKHGKGIHTIGGEQYKTQAGDILIYNSGVLHDERTNPDAEMIVYNCAVSNLKLEGLRENCLLPDGVSPVLHTGELREEIEKLFSIMYSQVYSQNIGSEEISNQLLYALIVIILKQINSYKKSEENEEYILWQRIKKYIDEHYFEDLTLESISKELNISVSYMCHVFKKTTGYAPIQYIMNRRIGKAQSLLIGTQYSATEIASMVGYDNPNYFNTIFKKTVGISPIKFRKRWVDERHMDRKSNKRYLV